MLKIYIDVGFCSFERKIIVMMKNKRKCKRLMRILEPRFLEVITGTMRNKSKCKMLMRIFKPHILEMVGLIAFKLLEWLILNSAISPSVVFFFALFCFNGNLYSLEA